MHDQNSAAELFERLKKKAPAYIDLVISETDEEFEAAFTARLIRLVILCLSTQIGSDKARERKPVFKLEDEILMPDRRFAALRKIDRSEIHPITIADHYRHVDNILIDSIAPLNVRAAFDRARNVFLYAWFCYELLVVSEL
jgi:hypothetical protein